MRKHNGMRPQDIVVLLKIIALGKKEWQMKNIADQLYLSPSEITESINRSQIAGLIDETKKKLEIKSFYCFYKMVCSLYFHNILALW